MRRQLLEVVRDKCVYVDICVCLSMFMRFGIVYVNSGEGEVAILADND